MKKMQRFTSIALAALMAAVALTGCGGNSSSASSAAASGGAGTSAASTGEGGLPLSAEPVELTVLTMRWGDMGDSFAKNQWIMDLEAKTNVKINWQVVSSSDWDEQKNIMLAGGELPDIVFGNQTFKDSDIMNNLDYFLPLEDLIEEHMPNYKAAMASYPDFKTITSYPDGHTYTLAKNLPSRPIACNQPIINKVWLDNLNLEVPTTLDELTAVLKAFKEQDANGNGDANDEIPISFGKDFHADFLNPFQISDYRSNGITKMDGKFVYFPVTENYKEGIKWLNQLYKDGLIDPESFTQDDQMSRDKKQNDAIALVGFTYSWSHDADFGKWSDEYIAIAPLKGPDGKIYAYGDHSGVHSIQRNEAAITTACKDPVLAAKWIDQFYESEASIQNFWGAIGTVISKNSDGTYTLNDPPAGTSADAWYWDQSLRDFGPKYVAPGFSDKILLSPEAGDGLKLEISKLAEDYVIDPFPDVIHTEEETEELATLTKDIDDYAKQMRAKWITSGDIDADWDSYIAQMEKMGVARYLEIKLAALERMK